MTTVVPASARVRAVVCAGSVTALPVRKAARLQVVMLCAVGSATGHRV